MEHILDTQGKKLVYSHEHIKLDLSTKERPNRVLDDKDAIIKELQELASKGVKYFIDVTNKGMGRDIKFIEEVSKASGIEFICACGYYKAPYLPPEVYDNSIEFLASLMVKEITEGIEGTTIKARVIGEIGTSLNEFKKEEMVVFLAGILAHKETGIPIVTHTTLATLGLEQVELFLKHNVDLGRVVLSHMDLSNDVSYIKEILKSGVNIGFDTIGKLNYQSDEYRISLLKELIKEGFLDQIVLSMDITNNQQLKSRGGVGYNYLMDSFIPNMLGAGIRNQDILSMLHHNPFRIFNLK